VEKEPNDVGASFLCRFVQGSGSEVSHGIDISTVFNERGYVGEVPAITGEKDGAIAESANLIDIYKWFTEVGQRFLVICAGNIHRVWSGERSLGVMGLKISS
jgi:hypothetical protein